MTHEVTDADLPHLRRCVELAAEAVEAGDFPFGSVLVAADGTVLAEDRNREVTAGDPTRHPEFELARWAAANMTPSERAAATVYTSGEHCPMCAAAHGWVGLGRIVYVTSTEQMGAWLAELGVSPAPVLPLAIPEVVPRRSWWQARSPAWPGRCATCTADSTQPRHGEASTARAGAALRGPEGEHGNRRAVGSLPYVSEVRLRALLAATAPVVRRPRCGLGACDGRGAAGAAAGLGTVSGPSRPSIRAGQRENCYGDDPGGAVEAADAAYGQSQIWSSQARSTTGEVRADADSMFRRARRRRRRWWCTGRRCRT
mgnify:CR=1 FL=1